MSYGVGVTSDAEDALVAFFESLPEAARREYAALAELDRRFGEDVHAERRGATTPAHGEDR
jgi:hypothetical protein